MNDDDRAETVTDEDEDATRFQMRITLPTDENGYTGRQCPDPACQRYFKVTFGTGLPAVAQSYCPYCGHAAEADRFLTPDQRAYVLSIFEGEVTNYLADQLKPYEFDMPPTGPFGIGLSLKIETTPPPILHYLEEQLETHVICANCTLRYAIYGVFAYCPDCGIHNSFQILQKNLEVAEKIAASAAQVDSDFDPNLAAQLIANALQAQVSAFDAFGRETCRIHAAQATSPDKVENLSFQNLPGAQKRVQQFFNLDLAASTPPDDWQFACRCFQKRHLLAHKAGVIDEDYVKRANDPQAIVGHKISLTPDEITRLAQILSLMGQHLVQELTPSAAAPDPTGETPESESRE
ncbi:MAG: hypothetical protein OJF49_003251 [Ktedonobacterales bacterium]|jgi:hypothetical protein|nr:MAG: hypothetical protein OJF49_003251 [Ktedonobacterales bacterium]